MLLRSVRALRPVGGAAVPPLARRSRRPAALGLADGHLPRRQHLHRPARVAGALPRGEGGRSDRGAADPAAVPAEPLHLAGLQRAAGSEQSVQPDRLGARHPRAAARRRERCRRRAGRGAEELSRTAARRAGTTAARAAGSAPPADAARRARRRSAPSTSASATRSCAISTRSSSSRRSTTPAAFERRTADGRGVMRLSLARSVAFEERLSERLGEPRRPRRRARCCSSPRSRSRPRPSTRT